MAPRKTHASQVCTGIGIAELTIGGAAGAASVADEYARAQKAYDSNPEGYVRTVGAFFADHLSP